MNYFLFLAGAAMVVITLLDAFEVVLLPQAVHRRWRINRFFFRTAWSGWAWCAGRLADDRRREEFLAVFGPLSMVSLFGLWGLLLIIGFGLMQWSLIPAGTAASSLLAQVIVSGDAFFTLGYGDNIPRDHLARALVIIEAGTGFGFIALTIGYLPVLYQHFSRRDVQLIEFSERAGSPPSALALLAWHAHGGPDALERWLGRWENWAGDLIESHAAYPMLAFYRSQHVGHSWVGSLATVLDVCTLVIAGPHDGRRQQATATFLALRRTLDEVSTALQVAKKPGAEARALDDAAIGELATAMQQILPDWQADAAAREAIDRLRASYDPGLGALAAYLLLPLPRWVGATPPTTACFSRATVVDRLTRREGD